MRRLFLVVVIMSLLTACRSAPRPSQGAKRDSGELRPAGAGQISPAKPGPASTSPASTSPASTSPVSDSPAPTVPNEPCTYPTAQTLQAKGRLLLADGSVSFYNYAWGTDCTFRQPVNTWLVSNGYVSSFLPDKGRINGVSLLLLPTGEHLYLVDGEPVSAAASAFYLAMVKFDQPRLFRFLDGSEESDMVASTGEPKLKGDLLDSSERVGGRSNMHYILGTWKLDPASMTATKVDEGEGRPVNFP